MPDHVRHDISSKLTVLVDCAFTVRQTFKVMVFTPRRVSFRHNSRSPTNRELERGSSARLRRPETASSRAGPRNDNHVADASLRTKRSNLVDKFGEPLCAQNHGDVIEVVGNFGRCYASIKPRRTPRETRWRLLGLRSSRSLRCLPGAASRFAFRRPAHRTR